MDKVLDTDWSVLPPGLKSEVRKGCLILVIFWGGEIGLPPPPSATAAMRCGSVHGASLIRVCLHSENGKQAERLMSQGPGEPRTLLAGFGGWGPAYGRRWETGCRAEWPRAGEKSLEAERPASH